ncbi:MAG: hypothetical protein K0R75_1779 [Paenibacillaceae bacterium]|jgi:hypothetical protein|nr:hypothetical protein [Paenibacillaceae bacterium]
MSKILAVVALDDSKVKGGGASTFYVSGEEELQKTAFMLEKILDASAHDLKNGSIIIVDHANHGDH